MHRPHRKEVLLPALVVLAIGLTAGQCLASFQFQFTTQDYAIETSYWGVAMFKTVCQNTGTQGDSIMFQLTQNLSPGWFGDFCMRGRCYFQRATLYFAPGQIDTIDVEVFVDDVSDMGLMTLTGTMKSATTETHNETYGTWNQLPSVLIVDDDAGQNYQTYLANALTAAGYPGRVYDANTLGRPSSVLLNSHWMVFWTTAGGDASYFTTADETNLTGFLNGRGKLFLASADFLSSRSGPSTFTTDYLHISSWTNNTGGNPISGVPGDPISSGMSLDLSGGPIPLGISDSFVRQSPADTIFSCVTGAKGLKVYDDTYRVVFLAFPFEDVSTAVANPNNQNTLIAKVMDWFDPPVAGFPEAVPPGRGLVLKQNSPNPFSTSTRISFVVPGGSADAQVAVHDVTGRVVKNLFRGAVGSGETAVTWDGRDHSGAAVAPGIYFCTIRADDQSRSVKIVVAR
jgi:hypothetical protein